MAFRLYGLNPPCSYLEARRRTFVEAGHKLVRHPLIDEQLVDNVDFILSCMSSYVQNLHLRSSSGDVRMSWWANELLAYPEIGGRFRKGQDIIDARSVMERMPWVLPWSELVRLGLGDAVLGPRVGLFLDPGSDVDRVKTERYKGRDAIVVHPESVSILTPFIQYELRLGLIDDATRIPLNPGHMFVTRDQAKKLRALARFKECGLRPLVRAVTFADESSLLKVFANSPYDENLEAVPEYPLAPERSPISH